MKKKRLIIGLLVFLIALSAGLIIHHAWQLTEPGWHNAGTESAYYVTDDRKKATGYLMIGDSPFYFEENGSPASKGWIDLDKAKDRKAYCLGEGKLATGWKYLDGKVYYFYQKNDKEKTVFPGAMAKNYTTSGKLHIPSKGYIDGDKGLALAYGIDVLNRYGWNLTDAYKYSSSLRFVEGSDKHYGLTIHSCALQGFEHGEGNCLAWSGTFCVMAKLLGYDCRHIWGTLEWRGTRPHAWTEIWDEDGVHVYDPRKNGGKDLGGFNVHYGQKGTYKYNLDSRQYLPW